MKINEGKFFKASGPPNEIYSAFEPLFLEIFDERPVYNNEPGDNRFYVSMPQVEAALKNVASSNTSATTLLVGSIGVGKSSVLRHLARTTWDGKNIKTIYLDLNRHKASLSPLNLPENFTKLEKDHQRHLAAQIVDRYVTAELSAFVVENMGDDPSIDDLFEFIWTNNKELLMELGLSMFKPRELEEKRQWLDHLYGKNLMGYLFVCLKFIAVENTFKKLVVIIDNCDQKDPVLIEAFVNAVAHLDNCFENLKGSYDFEPRLVSIISCRPPTRAFLLNSQKNALNTHGYKEILLDVPCHISAIIKCRIANLSEDPRYRDFKISTANGITWEIKHYKTFFEKLCQLLESSGRGHFLSSLCNRNVADTLKAMSEILSNNKFVDFGRIVENIVPEQPITESGLPKRIILRALAYGNPAEEVVYYPGETRIPNLLSGKYSLFPRTLLKPKIIGLLLPSMDQKVHWTFGKLLEIFQKLYGRPRGDVEEVFVDLYSEGLIETDRGYMPSTSSPDLRITATSRAQCLWQQFEKTDVLLGIYRDDISLTSRHQYIHVPTHELALLARCSEIVNCCEDCIEAEVRETRQIIDRVGLNEYRSLFDDSLLSEMLYRGTDNSILSFYSKRGAFNQEIGNRMDNLNNLLANAKLSIFSASY